MSFGDVIQKDLDREAADSQKQLTEDADREDRESWKNKFYEGMSGFGHKAANIAPAKGNNPALDDQIIKDNQESIAPPTAKPHQPNMSRGESNDMLEGQLEKKGGIAKGAKAAGGFVRDQVEGGVGGAFVDQMNKDTPAGVQASMPAPLRYGPEVEKALFGGLEQALVWGKGLGMVQAGVGRTLQPVTRFMPEMLKPIFKQALSVGSLSAGTEALEQKERGEDIHDIGDAAAFGALVGGAAGYLHPGDAEVLQKPENMQKLWQVAGGVYGKSMREMQRVAGRIAGNEYGSDIAMNKIAKFAQGSGDQSVAAKVRILSRSEPELFKDPVMKKILQSAGRDDAGEGSPAVPRTAPGTVARLFNYPAKKGEVVTHEGAPPMPDAKRGPLGIPLTAADDAAKIPQAWQKSPSSARPAPGERGNVARGRAPGAAAAKMDVATADGQAALIKGLAERKVGEPETPAGAAARQTVSKLVMDGTLKPEMVTVGAHARGVQMALGETARLLEAKGGDGYGAHLDAMSEWARRAKTLGGVADFGTKAVDQTSAVELKQLKDEIDGDAQVETNPTAPGKTKLTRGMMEKRRGKRPKFC